jgi:hypothetical protein
MGRKSDLLEERQSIVGWLLDALFGRTDSTEDDRGRAVRRMGDINQELDDDDDN